jgi:Asp-tRNA(Asn)/Glu-tRNA(Gln) amidotransferase B subunit
MAENEKAVADYRAGKQAAIGALIRDLTKKAPSANPKVAREVLQKLLG